jgi:hypothetical protein
MAKTKVSEWSSTASSNTDIDSINIAEGCAPSGINDAIRELMSQVKDWYSGSTGDALAVAGGGTGATSASSARTNLGIGTGDSPSFTGLTLSGGTANGVAYLNGSKVLTTGSALQFDGSNLGLGVTPSAWSASYKALQMSGGGMALMSASGSGFQFSNAYFDGSFKYYANGAASMYANGGGAHAWYIAASGTAGNAISFTQAMTLDASGNLGIGNTSPGSFGKLAVTGSLGTVSVSDNAAQLDFSRNAENYIRATAASGILCFNTGGAVERARIDSSGNLLVGSTTTSGGHVIVKDVTYNNWYTRTNHPTGTPSGYGYADFLYNGSNIGSITQNGTTGVLYNLTSDYRLKNNPVALTGAKDFVMALQPKTWDWWDGSGKGVGFIAHEFMEVAKYSGNGEKDAVDENGKPVYQSIQPSSSEVMANLVAHVQELERRLAALESN